MGSDVATATAFWRACFAKIWISCLFCRFNWSVMLGAEYFGNLEHFVLRNFFLLRFFQSICDVSDDVILGRTSLCMQLYCIVETMRWYLWSQWIVKRWIYLKVLVFIYFLYLKNAPYFQSFKLLFKLQYLCFYIYTKTKEDTISINCVD